MLVNKIPARHLRGHKAVNEAIRMQLVEITLFVLCDEKLKFPDISSAVKRVLARRHRHQLPTNIRSLIAGIDLIIAGRYCSRRICRVI